MRKARKPSALKLRTWCGHHSARRFHYPRQTGMFEQLAHNHVNMLAIIYFLVRWGSGEFLNGVEETKER